MVKDKIFDGGNSQVLASLLLIVCILFSITGRVEAESPDPFETYGDLLSKAQALGSVRIIVRLDIPFIPEGMMPTQEDTLNQQARISWSQTQLLEALSGYTVRDIKRFKYIPSIAMEVDSTALSVLCSSPLVISIEEDFPVPPALDESEPLKNTDGARAMGHTGLGWTIAILDTGVEKTHSFVGGGKVVSEACFSTTYAPYSTTVCPNGAESQIGSGAGVSCSTSVYGCDHGTHVAGIAAGRSASGNGVAKDANIIAVLVFSRVDNPTVCSSLPAPCALSFPSDLIEALEHVYSLRKTYNIASVNMSLGGGAYSTHCDSQSIKLAIDNLRSAGIATVIASGNSGYCGYISAPACISTAVSVGATTESDVEAFLNNHASILSPFAPGSSIYSSVPGGWASALNSLPNITVSIPDGGETWSAGSSYQIKWTYSGNPGTYAKIELLKKGALNRIIAPIASLGSGGTGSFNWSIPSTQVAGSDYTIRITSRTVPTCTDTSNGTFTIVGPFAAQATLFWDAPTTNTNGTPLKDLAGYKVYYGTAIRRYSKVVDVGNVTTYQVNNLTRGFTYYFAVKAYNRARKESDFSNEVSKAFTQYSPNSSQALHAEQYWQYWDTSYLLRSIGK